MPAQTVTSSLFKKLGGKLDAAVKKHAADETTYGIEDLPPGINNGVAKLVECGFGEYKTGANQGQPFFRAAGVIVAPEFVGVNGTRVKVAGRQTSVMHALCETKTQAGKMTTFEEHVGDVLNEFRKLGVETKGLGGDRFELVAAALKKQGPLFRFSTRPRKDQKTGEVSGCWETWHGAAGAEAPAEGERAVDDNTAASEPVDAVQGAGTSSDAIDDPNAGQGGDVSEDYSAETDLPTLLAAATGDDEPGGQSARDRLVALAVEAGHSEENATNAPDWPAVVALIESPAAPAVEVGAFYHFRPLDPKTKKAGKKKVECEVTEVNAEKETCTLRNNTDKKTLYKGVKWDQLEGE